MKAKAYLIGIIILLLFFSGCRSQKIPPLGQVDRVKVSGRALAESTEITSPEKIEKIIQFVNSLPDGWSEPWSGPPAASVLMEFWNDGKFIGNFGISSDFVTRDYDGLWSQSIPEKTTMAFAKAISDAIYEGAFEIIPPGVNLQKQLDSAEISMKRIPAGTEIQALYTFIQKSGFAITADYPGFINVTIERIHTGKYADTAITGQYVLDPNRKVKNLRFFGVEIKKKIVASQ